MPVPPVLASNRRFALSMACHEPMPHGASCALVRATKKGLDAVWLPLDHGPLPPGLIALTWDFRASWVEVNARIGFPTGDALLGSWPRLGPDWPTVVHPTIHEAQGLVEALAATRAILEVVLDACPGPRRSARRHQSHPRSRPRRLNPISAAGLDS